MFRAISRTSLSKYTFSLILYHSHMDTKTGLHTDSVCGHLWTLLMMEITSSVIVLGSLWNVDGQNGLKLQLFSLAIFNF